MASGRRAAALVVALAAAGLLGLAGWYLARSRPAARGGGLSGEVTVGGAATPEPSHAEAAVPATAEPAPPVSAAPARRAAAAAPQTAATLPAAPPATLPPPAPPGPVSFLPEASPAGTLKGIGKGLDKLVANTPLRPPEVAGHLEFEVLPATVRPGDAYVVETYLVNEGRKVIKLKEGRLRVDADGDGRTRDLVPRSKEIDAGKRALVDRYEGTWPEAGAVLRLEVEVLARNQDLYRGALTGRGGGAPRGGVPAATALRRAFVASSTAAEGSTASGAVAGFEDADVSVRKAAQAGVLEFEMNPAHVKGGDRYRLRAYLKNLGQRPLDLTGLEAIVTTNGQPQRPPAAPRVKQVGFRQRELVYETEGAWSPEAASWSFELVVQTASGDVYRNRLNWR